MAGEAAIAPGVVMVARKLLDFLCTREFHHAAGKTAGGIGHSREAQMPSSSTTRDATHRNGFRPRLDLTLVAFAVAGAAVAAMQPLRTYAGPQEGRYALAISNGGDLRLAAGAGANGAVVEPAARVLSCRRVVSVGPLDVGARCRTATDQPAGRGQTTAAAD